MSFVNYNNEWKLEYSPIRLINEVLSNTNTRSKIEYVDLDNPLSENVFKLQATDKLDKEIKRLQKTSLKSLVKVFKYQKGLICLSDTDIKNLFRKQIPSVLYDYANNIDKICTLKDLDTEPKLKEFLIYKNLLEIVSVKSLNELNRTRNKMYNKFPNEYYDEVSTKRTEFPKSINIDGMHYIYDYSTFNDYYRYSVRKRPYLFVDDINEEKLGVVLTNVELLPESRVYRVFKDSRKSGVKQTKNMTELVKKLKEKIAFYDETNPILTIKGVSGLKGYLGHVYENGYIILDRYYTSKFNTSKPAEGNAIYVVPIDYFYLLEEGKTDIIKFISNNLNSGIKRIYHNEAGTYKDKVIEKINEDTGKKIGQDDVKRLIKK